MIQICVDCKKEFDDPVPAHGGSRKKRCEECQKIHRKELQAAAWQRHKAALIRKARAETKERKDAAHAAPEAPAVPRVPASKKKGRPHFPAKAAPTPMPKGKNDHLSIEEVARMADAEGMSYGKYVALKLNRVRSKL